MVKPLMSGIDTKTKRASGDTNTCIITGALGIPELARHRRLLKFEDTWKLGGCFAHLRCPILFILPLLPQMELEGPSV